VTLHVVFVPEKGTYKRPSTWAGGRRCELGDEPDGRVGECGGRDRRAEPGQGTGCLGVVFSHKRVIRDARDRWPGVAGEVTPVAVHAHDWAVFPLLLKW
jgi:hypothetical protein